MSSDAPSDSEKLLLSALERVERQYKPGVQREIAQSGSPEGSASDVMQSLAGSVFRKKNEGYFKDVDDPDQAAGIVAGIFHHKKADYFRRHHAEMRDVRVTRTLGTTPGEILESLVLPAEDSDSRSRERVLVDLLTRPDGPCRACLRKTKRWDRRFDVLLDRFDAPTEEIAEELRIVPRRVRQLMGSLVELLRLSSNDLVATLDSSPSPPSPPE